jgi:L-amino acid N-acyltransferase YncA
MFRNDLFCAKSGYIVEDKLTLIRVTPDNVDKSGVFCIKNPKSPGYQAKKNWFVQQYQDGLRIILAKDENGSQLGFIEYVPAEFAWRPVKAPGYVFIQCIMVPSRKGHRPGIGKRLLSACESDAREQGFHGIVVMTSKGAWMATEQLFGKAGYSECDRHGRFNLMVKRFTDIEAPARLIRWDERTQTYDGWNLIFAHQCPWHQKAVDAMTKVASAYGIELKVNCLETARDAQNSPSGFGVFSLVRDGRLLEDHYLSETRFRTIVEKELSLNP